MVEFSGAMGSETRHLNYRHLQRKWLQNAIRRKGCVRVCLTTCVREADSILNVSRMVRILTLNSYHT